MSPNRPSGRFGRAVAVKLRAASSLLHRTYVGGIQRGERDVGIEKLARALGAGVADLLAREGDARPTASPDLRLRSAVADLKVVGGGFHEHTSPCLQPACAG